MKNLARRICSFLMILMIVNLIGCSNRSISTATPAILSTVTNTAMSPTNIATLAVADTIFPTVPVISLSENDEQYLQLKDRGYHLISSGSFIGPKGFTYSAYMFLNPSLSPLYGASETSKDAMLISFYSWNGEKNEFMSVQGLPTIDNIYAVGAAIVNWDQPFSISNAISLDVLVETDEETKPILKQENYSSDINQNGLPEFAIAVEYCPISCTHPTGGIQLFEIQNPSTIKNITQDLPGLTFFEMHSKNPFTFFVGDTDFYDIYLDIWSNWIYSWDGSKFVDVSSNYADEYLTEANSIINDLKSQYGKPFDKGGRQSEMKSLKILKLYEKAGMSADGLQVFLDITNISHWNNTSNLSRCWLQISRAMAQEDFKQNRGFDLPTSSSYWANNLELVKKYEESLKQAGYDTSACTSS